jgi:hypothetical protein
MSANACIAGWMQKGRCDYRRARLLSHGDAHLSRRNKRRAKRGIRNSGDERRLAIGDRRALVSPLANTGAATDCGSLTCNAAGAVLRVPESEVGRQAFSPLPVRVT